MANNRMWLVCNKCNEGVLLGKRMMGPYYNHYHGDKLGKILDNFYEKHMLCGYDLYELKYDDDFNGKTFNDSEGDYKEKFKDLLKKQKENYEKETGQSPNMICVSENNLTLMSDQEGIKYEYGDTVHGMEILSIEEYKRRVL